MPVFSQKAGYPYTLFSMFRQKGFEHLGYFTFQNAHSDLPLLGGTVTTNRVSNPNWKIQLAKGQSATNAYSVNGYRSKMQLSSASLTTPNPVSGSVIDSFHFMRYITGPSTFPSTSTALRDLALTRLKRKLGKHVGDFKALVPLAEIRDLRTTVRAATELTTGLVQTLVDIKRGKWSRVKAHQKASKAWLTYGFGIRPMLSDIDALNVAITEFILRSDHNVRLAGSAKTEWFSVSTQGGTTCNQLGPAVSRIEVRHELSYRYLAGFKLPLKSGNNYDFERQFGLTLPDVLPALWEATAFSWVFDYFTNVGELLEDVFVSPPGDVIYALQNRRYYASFRITQDVVPSPPAVFQYNKQAVHHVEYFEFERAPITVLPHVGFRFRTVDEIGQFGVTKLLNLASILGSKARV